jgi:DHA1 family inner membrane transport protein
VQAPLRLLNAFRTSVEPGLLIATAVSTAVFMATPLVLSDIIEEFDVGPAAASLVSGVQLGGFVLATWGAGRFAAASSRVFVLACVVLAGAGATSAVAPGFELLLASRAISGIALGTLTWLSWSEVFGDSDKMGDVSAVGPLAGVAAAPAFGALIAVSGFRAVFLLVAVLSLVPLVRVPTFAGASTPEERGARSRPVAAAVAIVAALGLLTMGGSATFAFAGVIARDEIGMGAVAVSLVFAGNALAQIPAARWRGGRPMAGGWFVATAVCAFTVAITRTSIVFSMALVAWGFLFWAGVPGVFALLAARSRHPAERAGDAQAVMAIGRVAGPLTAGVLVGAGSFTTLGIASGALMGTAGIVALAVELRRG